MPGHEQVPLKATDEVTQPSVAARQDTVSWHEWIKGDATDGTTGPLV